MDFIFALVGLTGVRLLLRASREMTRNPVSGQHRTKRVGIIGAGDADWAARVGNRMILICVCFMGGIGVAIAAAGPWLVPWFIGAEDPSAAAVMPMVPTTKKRRRPKRSL
mgnify:CR=1 FL=1